MTEANEASIGRKTAVGAGWLVASRMFSRSIGLISTLVLARVLEPTDFGLLGMATTFVDAIEAFLQFGVQDALIRSSNRDRDLYDTAFTLLVIRALTSGLIIAAGAYPASLYFDEPRLVNVVLVIAFVAILSVENIGVVEFRRDMRFGVQFLLLAVPRVIQFVLALAVALIFRSYWALLVGTVSARVSYIAFTYIIHPYRPRLTLVRWRDLVGFSFWTWASSIGRIVLQRSDAFLIGPRIGSANLGIYLVATEVALLPVTELIAPVAAAMFPGLAMAQRNGKNTLAMCLPVVASLLLLLVPLTIALSGAAGYVIEVMLGPKWTAAQPLVSVMVWASIFYSVNRVCSTAMVVRGEVRNDFLAVSSAAVVRMVGLYMAASTGDLRTVAIVSVCCAAAEALLSLIALRSSGKLDSRDVAPTLLRIATAGSVTAAALAASGVGWQAVTMPSATAFLVGGLIVSAVVACFVALTLLFWRLAGRPDGPELQVFALINGLRQRAMMMIRT